MSEVENKQPIFFVLPFDKFQQQKQRNYFVKK